MFAYYPFGSFSGVHQPETLVQGLTDNIYEYMWIILGQLKKSCLNDRCNIGGELIVIKVWLWYQHFELRLLTKR